MRVYHHRVRSGRLVTWVEDNGRLRALAPPIAVSILTDAIGRLPAPAVVQDFAAALDSWGRAWDATEREIREWADGRPGA